MQSDLPKVLHPALGLTLVEHVARAAAAVGAQRQVVVASPEHQAAIAAELAPWAEAAGVTLDVVVQHEPKGTAHAVQAAQASLADFSGRALVLMGDVPCISPASLQALLDGHTGGVTLLSGRVDDPFAYGRVVREGGALRAIVEEKDADEATRAIQEINVGIYVFDLPRAFAWLERVTPSPRTGELYLTQLVELARADGAPTAAVEAATPEDMLGVNTRVQLAQATAALQARTNQAHMLNGVTFVDPTSAFIDVRATIGRDARIEPFVVVEGASRIGPGAVVGPFAHVRGDSELGPEARIGNFVEVVRSSVGARARALHLAYLGDATLGAETNVGAGVVFANHDGERHHASQVGERVALGANSVVIGPSRLHDGARTGAGAVVNQAEVPAGETWVGVPASVISRGVR
ncbi:MAG: bifunctional N-acetylglucosamine-1-phosphate uridyltransferase/glucosamine-1-phosphate acetyltransferase [Planctomycetes bacterium]|nr:bifunctional N-acetylglucosamine-1-phosphate uridyltransferase/glucosamine-1-phosphate acetyltransferase [Planctomycetota bacterium]